jgi:hypothetical protein
MRLPCLLAINMTQSGGLGYTARTSRGIDGERIVSIAVRPNGALVAVTTAGRI